MVKRIRNVRSGKFKDPIKCPSCGRVLGCVNAVLGQVSITYICQRCGDVSVELENMRDREEVNPVGT